LIIGSIFITNFQSTNSFAGVNNAIEEQAVYSLLAPSAENATIFGDPILNPTEPATNQTTSVTMLITDLDGIQNSTLFWQYTSINNTLFNASMTKVKNLVDTQSSFPRTGFITDTGVETDSTTDWMFGEYIYDTAPGESLTEIDTTILKPTQNNLVYVLIEAKNATDGTWNTVLETGTIGGTVDLGDTSYLSTNVTIGYRIYAITYKTGIGGQKPPGLSLSLYREEYQASIPGVDQPTFVDYYITVFDALNNSATSDTFTFLLDWAPTVTFFDTPPSAIKTDEEYIVNVTVTDLDNATDIDDSSVNAYYRVESVSELSFVNLALQFKGSQSAVYSGTIPAQNIADAESKLFVLVNASDTFGRSGSTANISIVIDSLHPRVTNIVLDTGVVLNNVQNISLISSEVNITAEFTDSAGIKSASIYYAIPNGTSFVKKDMTNLTLTGLNLSPVEFFVTLPPTNVTGYVEYFFETTDFFGNTGNTSINFYYADGDAPILDTYLIYPLAISDSINATLLFNVTDFIDIKQSVVWYSYDNGTTWSNSVGYPIDYSLEVFYQETFANTNLPFLIEDNDISRVQLEVVRGDKVDSATLRAEIFHDKPTDLRVWLVTDDGRKFMIFDREAVSSNIVLNVDLFALGLTQKDFTRANFTLEMQDFSDLYSGSLTKFEIELVRYNFPLGYQFKATIPASGTDTEVLFYITMTDVLWNAQNSTTLSYYADGLAPEIEVQTILSPLDLAGEHGIVVTAKITDFGGIYSAEIYYNVDNDSEWNVLAMVYDPSTELYSVVVPIFNEQGTLTFQIRAFDVSGLSNETEFFSIDYINGFAPVIIVQDAPFSSVLDMQKAQAIRVIANVTDDGIVQNVTIFYRFSDDQEWIQAEMIFDNETNTYFYDVIVPTSEGVLSFKILSTDDNGLTGETEIFSLSFENANPPSSDLLPLLVVALIGLGGAGAGTVVYLRKTGKWPKKEDSFD
jgi:hypothetical protein